MANVFNEAQYPVSFWHRIKRKDKALFYEHLANLIEGGVSLVNSIDSFVDKTPNPRMKRDVALLKFFIESGDSFAMAMKKIPQTFDKQEIAIIESGESSGMIFRSFSYLAKSFRDADVLYEKVTQALTAPFIILLFFVGALALILTYVIPKLMPLFETSGTEVPFATQSLIFMSNFVMGNFGLIVLVIIAAIVGISTFAKTTSGRRSIDTFLLEFPLIGDIYRNYIVVRVASNLGMLLEAGIPILKAISLTGAATNNSLYEEALYYIAESVAKGKRLVESIEEIDPKGRLFPRDFVQMLGAGEKTSTVNKVCIKISEIYNREVDHSVGILVKWIEPMAILFAGIFVFWFAFAIFSAVLKITQSVGG